MSKFLPLARLRVVRSMDSISPYQAILYTFIFVWGVYSVFIRRSDAWWWIIPSGTMGVVEEIAITLILFWAPLLALAGYLLRHKVFGIWITLSADSAIMFALIGYSAELLNYSGNLVELAYAISWAITLGVAVRVVRDILFINIVNRSTHISDASIERAKESLSIRTAERHLELQAAEETVELRQIEASLIGILNLLKQRYNG